LPRAARRQDPAPAHARALRERDGAGAVPRDAPRGAGRDLSRAGVAPAPCAGQAADGRLRRHGLGPAEGRLRSGEALLRAHGAVHAGRAPGRRREPGEPPGGDDPRQRAARAARGTRDHRQPGAPERGDRGRGGPARGPGKGARRVSSLWRDLAASFRNPEFWALSRWLDIMVRNRQSRLGVFWLLVLTIVYIWGIGGMFASMMGLSFREFVAYVALGYVVFRLISAVITESSGAFLSAASFILDGHLRLTDFILRVVAKALFYFLVSLPVVAASVYLSPDWHWQALPASLLALAWMTGITLCIGVVF